MYPQLPQEEDPNVRIDAEIERRLFDENYTEPDPMPFSYYWDDEDLYPPDEDDDIPNPDDLEGVL